MEIIFLDYETFYSNEYTLSKMTTEEYIRDPRFEALCVSVVRNGKGVSIPQEQLGAFFAGYDWSNKAVCCHHAQFDGLIMSHHYGIKPKFWFDTISMGRIVYGPKQRLSLAKLLELHGLAPKTIDYNEFKGKRWHQMGAHTRRMLLDGAVHDGIQTEKLFYLMLPHISTTELAVIDRTIRTFTEPVCEGDIELLREVCYEEVTRKENALHELGVKKGDLASADKMVELLIREGVEVEYKESKTIDKKTGQPKLNPCFAKSDPFMQELLDDENPRVRALAEARLDVKSTLNETRSGRMLRMAERGPMAIYLNHGATHTLRVTGGERMNWVNLPRGGKLRKSLKAPEGKKLSVKDYNAFELRLGLYVSGQRDKLDLIEAGGDLYCDFGTSLYGRVITKADERERYISKQVVLGSQYRQGEEKLYRELNFKHKVSVPMEFCGTAVHTFRKVEFPCIGGRNGVWKQLDNLIPHVAAHESFKWKMFEFRDGKCYLPNGCYMHFENIEWHENPAQYNGGSWRFEKRKGMWVNFHGGIFFENLIQFLQRCVAAEALIKMPRNAPMIIWPYDEFVNVVHGEDQHNELIQIMNDAIPEWLPDFKVKVEGGVYDRYEK